LTIEELAQEARDLCDADSTSYPSTTLLRRINSSIETIVGKIIEVCRYFPFDDENYSNIAEATVTLSEGVSKYTITDRFLTILEVKVKDTNGRWNIVEPVPQFSDDNIVETDEASSGLPSKYRMVGRTIFLRLAPTSTSVTLTSGLLIKYTRTSYKVTASDLSTGTLVIGLPTIYHSLIAKMSALPYNKLYHPERVPQLERDIMIETKDCVDFFSNRLKDKNNRLEARIESNK